MQLQKNVKPMAAVDLFCGVGGLTHGLIQESIVIRAGIDIDRNCKYPFEVNNDAPFVIKDVADLTGQEINSLFGKDEIKILAGCAPCQPFSKYTQGKDNSRDQKWGMLYEFSRLVKEVEPDVVTMENVPQLTRSPVYDDFKRSLEVLGYKISCKIVYCPDYGIPQTRQRLVLLASKFGELKLDAPNVNRGEDCTVESAIGHLPPLNHGEKCASDPVHVCSALSDLNLKRIRSSKPDGSWLDWDENLVAECHKRHSTYRGVYGRMSLNKPSPTITTQFTGFGNGRFGHPEQDRALSLREGALLQTFPSQYQFVPPGGLVSIKQLSKMIGNAVPVQLGRVIGASIRKHIEEYCCNGK